MRKQAHPLPPYDAELLEVEDTQHLSVPTSYQELERLRKEEPPHDEAIYNDSALAISHISIPSPTGTIDAIVVRRKVVSEPTLSRPGILYVHGGGRIMGNTYVGLAVVIDAVKELDAVIISISYRLAPDFPGIAAVEDCYAALSWLSSNADAFSIDKRRLLIAGVSAGAGIAAGTVLLSRDREGPKVCAQLLCCPMLDDRMESLSSIQFENGRGYYTAFGHYAWSCVLGPQYKTDEVSIYVSPGRANDLSNLPPAYIDAGSMEPFRDEDIAYATKLWECGVQADLHIWGGGSHGFDLFCRTQLGQQAFAVRNQWIRKVLTSKE